MIASQTWFTILRKPSQLSYAQITAATSAPIAVITKPIGLADSTRFNIFCTPVHIVVAAVTAFCAAAVASAATLFLIIAPVDTAQAFAPAYTVVDRVFIPVTKVATLPTALVASAAILTNGSVPLTSSPNLSWTSPNLASNCTCLPTSVAPNCAFISPTLLVITWASIAARSLSVPYFSTFSSASSNVIPTRVKADTWPCITLPIKLPIATASWPVAE